MAVVDLSIMDVVFIPANPAVAAPHLMVIMVQVVMVVLHHGTLHTHLATLALLHVNVDGDILVDMSVDQDVDIVDGDPHGMFVVSGGQVYCLMRGPATVMRTIRHQSSSASISLLPPCLLVGVLNVSAGVMNMSRVMVMMVVIIMRVFPVAMMSMVTVMVVVMTMSPHIMVMT